MQEKSAPYNESDQSGASDSRVGFASDSRRIVDEGIQRFSERLKEVVGIASLRGFARDSGLSEGVLRSYLRCQTFPTLDRLDAIASAGEVKAAWLATGEGPKHKGDEAAPAGPLDMARLTLAMETVEEGLRVTGRTMASDKKAELVAAVYDLFEERTPAMKERVLRLVKSAA